MKYLCPPRILCELEVLLVCLRARLHVPPVLCELEALLTCLRAC